MDRIVSIALALFIGATLGFTPAARAAAPVHCLGCNFSHADMHGLDLHGVDYVGADFSGANLRGANLRGARLVGANLRDADLRDADMRGANLTGCNLLGAKLGGAKFDRTHLTGAKLPPDLDGLDGAALRGLLDDCTGCDVQGAVLNQRDLHGITMIGGNLTNALAAHANFADANLTGVDFDDADLRDANFAGATVCWHSIHEMDDNVERGDLDCIDLRGAKLAGASFRGARICDRLHGQTQCAPVDAAMLRAHSYSSLEGATF